MKSFLLPAFLLLTGVAMADSLILKNGNELKGDILNDGPDGILIDYYVTPTIRDQKLVSRDEIAKIQVIQADEKAYKDLVSQTPPPTLLDTSFHDILIEKKIPEFLSKYPYSKHLSDVRARLVPLGEERSRIRNGDRRVDGTWYTAAVLAADPYQTTALLNLASMKERGAAGDPAAGLQQYELIEKNYPGSRVMPEAVDAALVQIDQLRDRLAKVKADFDVLDKKRQWALAVAPADQAKELRDALDKETVTAKAAMTRSQADGTKFFAVFPNNKEALDALQALGESERTRLLILQKTPMRDGLASSAQAAQMLASGKLKDAQDQLALSQKLWPANHDLVAVAAELEQQNKAASAQASQHKESPTPSPSSKK